MAKQIQLILEWFMLSQHYRYTRKGLGSPEIRSTSWIYWSPITLPQHCTFWVFTTHGATIEEDFVFLYSNLWGFITADWAEGMQLVGFLVCIIAEYSARKLKLSKNEWYCPCSHSRSFEIHLDWIFGNSKFHGFLSMLMSYQLVIDRWID